MLAGPPAASRLRVRRRPPELAANRSQPNASATRKSKIKILLRLVRASHDLGSFLVPKHGSEEPARAGSRKPLLRFIFVLKTWFQNFIKSWFRFCTEIWGQFWTQNPGSIFAFRMRPHIDFLQLNITSRHQAWRQVLRSKLEPISEFKN